ncbi:DUF3089 domain-containing protein [Novosphingobium sp.]|uniref:DUF3089 domain-containing protein n=1 Tax=Novosphingobium sp. TaxID=1874826 RepID=UPI0031DB62A4
MKCLERVFTPRVLLAALMLALPWPAAAQDVPPPPDYALPSSWSQAWRTLPAGATPMARHPQVAVFFLHPTTFRSPTGAQNEDTQDSDANSWTDESSIARQASIFNGCCRVYAPRYRAASYNSFTTPAQQKAAFALAYSDVERAFDAFLARIGDAPFILAGHSQGAFHAATLLEKRIDGQPLQKRMVAAYIIGINLSQGEFGKRFKTVTPCATPAQTGCVLQWNSYLADEVNIPKINTVAQAAYVKTYGDGADKQLVCINPLTFDAARPEGGRELAQGAVPGDPGRGPMRPLLAHGVAARCVSGLLLVQPDQALDLQSMPGGVMHYHDLGLFWADVRANLAVRIRAFLKKGLGGKD